MLIYFLCTCISQFFYKSHHLLVIRKSNNLLSSFILIKTNPFFKKILGFLSSRNNFQIASRDNDFYPRRQLVRTFLITQLDKGRMALPKASASYSFSGLSSALCPKAKQTSSSPAPFILCLLSHQSHHLQSHVPLVRRNHVTSFQNPVESQVLVGLNKSRRFQRFRVTVQGLPL